MSDAVAKLRFDLLANLASFAGPIKSAGDDADKMAAGSTRHSMALGRAGTRQAGNAGLATGHALGRLIPGRFPNASLPATRA